MDYDSASGTLTFVPGDTEELISITVHGDELDEPGVLFGAEWLFIAMSSPVNASFGPGLFGALAPGSSSTTTRHLSSRAEHRSVTEGDAGPVELQIPVRLSAPSGSTVTVNWTTTPAPAWYRARTMCRRAGP